MARGVVWMLLLLLAGLPGAAWGAQGTSSQPYLLHQGDGLSIVVLGIDPPLTYTAAVLPDGTFTLPLVGRVPCDGLSTTQVEAELTARFGRRLRAPEVSVRVMSPRPLRVYTLGAGISAAAWELGPGWRVSHLVAAAGGLYGSPHVLQSELRRADGRVFAVDLEAVLSGTAPSADVALEEGDVLVVQDPRAAGVMVAGAVISPGTVLLSGGQGATVAVTRCGGVMPGSDPSRVLLVRADRTQAVVDLRPALVDKDMAKDIPVRSGDMVIVPWMPEQRPGVTISGSVARPGFVGLDPRQRWTVADMVMGPAGGLVAGAGKADIVLLRPADAGLERIPGDGEALWNEVLRPRDLIWVSPTSGSAPAAKGD